MVVTRSQSRKEIKLQRKKCTVSPVFRKRVTFKDEMDTVSKMYELLNAHDGKSGTVVVKTTCLWSPLVCLQICTETREIVMWMTNPKQYAWSKPLIDQDVLEVLKTCFDDRLKQSKTTMFASWSENNNFNLPPATDGNVRFFNIPGSDFDMTASRPVLECLLKCLLAANNDLPLCTPKFIEL